MTDRGPWGGQIYNIPVYQPSYLKRIEYDCVLVVPGNHKLEIMQQLMSMGVDESKIIPWFPDGGHGWQRKNVSFKGDYLLAEMDNLKIKLKHSSDFLAFEEIYLRNNYDFYYSDKTACIAVDIGMNIGLATLMLANRPEVFHVYSFEPFLETYTQAQNNLSMNPHLQSKVSMYNYGLSNSEMTQKISYNADFPGGMRTGSAFEGTSQGGEEIYLKDASAVLKPIFDAHQDKNIIVKIDCEGSEYSIFDSLERTGLLSIPKIYIMETHDGREQELLLALRKAGYTYFAPYDGRDGLGSIYAVKCEK